jgi:gas vesicle protein
MMIQNAQEAIMSQEHVNQSMMAFVWGAAVGAGIALLVAPKSGHDTRQQLGNAARRLGETAKSKLEHAKATVHDGVDTVNEAIGAGRAAFQSAAKETTTNPRRV